jgi:hypothetical protein
MRIGITGYARAGKDEVANVFIEQFGFVKINMSDALDKYLRILDPWVFVSIFDVVDITDALDRDAPLVPGRWYRYSEICVQIPDYTTRKLIKEVRELLQRLGTDVGRAIDPMLWVDELNKEAHKHAFVVTTGIRFTEEVEPLDYLIHVDRPGVGPINDHDSENLDAIFARAHVKIDNDSDILDLRARVYDVAFWLGLVSP